MPMIYWDMFTNGLKNYEICLFILVGHHTMESIYFLWFLKYTWTKYWSIFVVQFVANNVTLNIIESIVLTIILCVYGGLFKS